MSIKKSTLTQSRLKELLHYSPETGSFTALTATGWRGCHRAGKIVGSLCAHNRYIHVYAESVHYRAHRLAWFYMTGAWPKQQIDHINGNRADNRWSNLREASNSENQQNLKTAKKGNKSGYLGVAWHSTKRKWMTRIKVAGKAIYIGIYDTPEEAREAYLAAKAKLHPFGSIGHERQ